METGVIVRELLAEVRGHIIAVRKLRLGLGEISEGLYESPAASSILSQNSRIPHEVNIYECSDDEDGDEPDGPPDAADTSTDVDLNEEDFLTEFDSLEKNLSIICDK